MFLKYNKNIQVTENDTKITFNNQAAFCLFVKLIWRRWKNVQVAHKYSANQNQLLNYK